MRRMSFALLLAVGAALALLAAPAPRVGATAPPLPFDCDLLVPTITGSGTITGTSGDDVIVGSSGADQIRGNGGDDHICGLGGDDTIYGGSGADMLLGNEGSDAVNGDAGDDFLIGDGDFSDLESYDDTEDLPLDIDCAGLGGGDDVLKGGSGDDIVLDPCGANQAYGGQGSDALGVTGFGDGGSGNDIDDDEGVPDFPYPFQVNTTYDEPLVVANETSLGAGDATAKGGSGKDLVVVIGGLADGGSGNDEVRGIAAGDEVRGGSANDLLINANPFGADLTLNGGSGFDVCSPQAGDTVISCEA